MFFENQAFESNIPPYCKRCEAAGIVLTSDLLNACGTATTPRGSGYATNLVGGLPATWANLAAMMKAPVQKRQDALENLRATRKAKMSAAWLISFEGMLKEARHEVTLKIQHAQHTTLVLETAQRGDTRDQLVESDQALRVGVKG